MKQKMLVTLADIHYHVAEECVAVGLCGARQLPDGKIVPVILVYPIAFN